MSARTNPRLAERLDEAIRRTSRSSPSREESPEAYGRRIADELFEQATKNTEVKGDQR